MSALLARTSGASLGLMSMWRSSTAPLLDQRDGLELRVRRATSNTYRSMGGNANGVNLGQTTALVTPVRYDEGATFTLENLRDLVAASFSDTQLVLDLADVEPDAPLLREAVTIMSLFRKDLFVSVTLPIVAIAVGAYVFTWQSFTRVDDAINVVKDSVGEIAKLQAISTEQLTQLTKGQEKSVEKLDRLAEQLNQVNATLLVVKSHTERPDSR